ncbi:hypothetical protein EC988_001155 [Linderina pennispora]|nr:hypothetical protein EC988_001155 [Linderina pennispora]
MSQGTFICQILRVPGAGRTAGYGQNLAYPSCPQCSRKVTAQGQCKNCGTTGIQWVFKIAMAISPIHTHATWHATAFGGTAERWFGCSAMQWVEGAKGDQATVDRFFALLEVFGTAWAKVGVRRGRPGSSGGGQGVITKASGVVDAAVFGLPITVLWQMADGSMPARVLEGSSACEVYESETISASDETYDASALLAAWQTGRAPSWETAEPYDMVSDSEIVAALQNVSQLFSDASTYMSGSLAAFQYEESLQHEHQDELLNLHTPQRPVRTPVGYTPPDTLLRWLEMPPSYQRPSTELPEVLAPETPPTPVRAARSVGKRRLFVGESPVRLRPTRRATMRVAFESVPETPVSRAESSGNAYSRLRRRQYAMAAPLMVPETPAVKRSRPEK